MLLILITLYFLGFVTFWCLGTITTSTTRLSNINSSTSTINIQTWFLSHMRKMDGVRALINRKDTWMNQLLHGLHGAPKRRPDPWTQTRWTWTCFLVNQWQCPLPLPSTSTNRATKQPHHTPNPQTLTCSPVSRCQCLPHLLTTTPTWRNDDFVIRPSTIYTLFHIN